jgi:HK97 family phage prohead protease
VEGARGGAHAEDARGRQMSTVLESRRQRAEALRGSKVPERRSLSAGSCELRATDESDGLYRFEGYASLTEVDYQVGDFVERIAKGAFKRTLAEPGLDCVLRAEHRGFPLARTARPHSDAPASLFLSEDNRGLLVRAELSKEDPDARVLKLKMERGLVDEMSFAFRTTDDAWDSAYQNRTVKSVTLAGGDVSLVTYGASPSTGATTSIRSAELYDVEVRGRYAAHELAELGGKGEAFKNPDGHWSFPTHDRDDWEKAKDAVGRSGSEHDAVRKYLIGWAAAMGLTHLVPATWRADGSLLGTLAPKRAALVDLQAAALDLETLRRRPTLLRTVENDDSTITEDEVTCKTCAGAGTVGGKQCVTCKGAGKVPGKAPKIKSVHPEDGRGALRPHELRALERERRVEAAQRHRERARRSALGMR